MVFTMEIYVVHAVDFALIGGRGVIRCACDHNGGILQTISLPHELRS